jgi:hypothetical protein
MLEHDRRTVPLIDVGHPPALYLDEFLFGESSCGHHSLLGFVDGREASVVVATRKTTAALATKAGAIPA